MGSVTREPKTPHICSRLLGFRWLGCADADADGDESAMVCGMVCAWSCGLYLHKLWPCCPAGIAFCIRNLHLHVNFIGEGEKTRRLRSKTNRSSDTFNEWSEKHGTKATIDKFICEIWLFIFLYYILKFHSYTTKLLLKSPSNFLYFYTN